MSREIPLFKIYWDEEDVKSVTNALKRGINWAIGPNIAQFEEEISAYLSSEYCVTFNSGTSALHAVLLAYGVGEGDEVIVSSFTFIATANAPLFVGAKPVFADIEDKVLGLDPNDVKRKITKKTKAIIPVHYAGCPCLIEELRAVARDYNVLLIEDAAEAFGASINGKKVGTYGHSAILSFCQNKVITTGEGGAVVTNSKEIYEKLKFIRSHGRLENSDYFSSSDYTDYMTLGYNFRMSNITAALGLAQLSKVDKIINVRRQNAYLMSHKLSQIGGVTVLEPPKDFFHVYQMYAIRVANKVRDDLADYLMEKGIMSKVHFHPVHLSSFYRYTFGYREGELPITEKISKEILTLPMYPTLNEDDIEYIRGEINNFFSRVLSELRL